MHVGPLGYRKRKPRQPSTDLLPRWQAVACTNQPTGMHPTPRTCRLRTAASSVAAAPAGSGPPRVQPTDANTLSRSASTCRGQIAWVGRVRTTGSAKSCGMPACLGEKALHAAHCLPPSPGGSTSKPHATVKRASQDTWHGHVSRGQTCACSWRLRAASAALSVEPDASASTRGYTTSSSACNGASRVHGAMSAAAPGIMSGMAGTGMSSMARSVHGAARAWHGMAGRGMAWAWRGTAWQGMARKGAGMSIAGMTW